MNASTTLADAGLDRLIRDAIHVAAQIGKPEIVSSLQAALSATAGTGLELDLIAADVRRDGKAIALSRGERALLMVLALQRRPCSRAELIELLYPHLDPENAATQLKVYVHRVRRKLCDAGVIEFARDTYRLGDSVALDYWQIQADVEEAVRIKGSIGDETLGRLDQIRLRLVRRNVSWSADYEWGAALDRRLESLLFDVTTRLAESALASGDVAAALRFAIEIAHLDPCDERAARIAIQAHLTDGDREAAVRALRRYETILKNEYGDKPSPDLLALIA